VIEKLREWLLSQGYPLEMRVAQHLRQAGLRVTQSEVYTDPETGKIRETDVVGRLWTAFDIMERIDVSLGLSAVVECKQSRDKPWILFTTDTSELHRRLTLSTRIASDFASFVVSRVDTDAIATLPAFALGPRHAYSISQAFRKDAPDAAYSAVTAVLNAARAQCAFRLTSGLRIDAAFELALPLVVIEGRLFECFLTDGSSPQLEEVEHGSLLWREPGARWLTINVMTIEYLERFVPSLKTAFDALLELPRSDLALSWLDKYGRSNLSDVTISWLDKYGPSHQRSGGLS
jgi:hypothetical protein